MTKRKGTAPDRRLWWISNRPWIASAADQ